MKARQLIQFLPPVFFLLALAGWIVLVNYIRPEEIIDQLGITNGYAIAFVSGFLGGLSTFVSFPYYLLVAMLAGGGLNPFLVGLWAGIGVVCGDTISYILGYKGKSYVPIDIKALVKKYCPICFKLPSWLVPAVLFFYGALVPFPNDLIVISMGLARYSFVRLMVPLGLGNVIFNIAVAMLGAYGFGN